MKSLAELKEIRDKARENMTIREGRADAAHVVVGMATCGIAAGARPVLSAFVEEVAKEKLNVRVGQMGCIGICRHEPVVEVTEQDGTKTTYVNMTPEKAVQVVHQHLIGGKVIAGYTIENMGK